MDWQTTVYGICGLAIIMAFFGWETVADKGHISRWLKARADEKRRQADHKRKLELMEIEHKNRLELAGKLDTTLHVLIADQPLGESLRDRLNEAFPPPPKARVEVPSEDDDDEEEERDERKQRRKRRKSG